MLPDTASHRGLRRAGGSRHPCPRASRKSKPAVLTKLGGESSALAAGPARTTTAICKLKRARDKFSLKRRIAAKVETSMGFETARPTTGYLPYLLPVCMEKNSECCDDTDLCLLPLSNGRKVNHSTQENGSRGNFFVQWRLLHRISRCHCSHPRGCSAGVHFIAGAVRQLRGGFKS